MGILGPAGTYLGVMARGLQFLIAVLLSVATASAAPALDPARLAQIEKDLSVPICGVGYLDTRSDQLKQAGKFDKLPYLEHMARTRYTDKGKQYLPVLAVQLMARGKQRQALTRVVKDNSIAGEVRYEAARLLAQELHSRAGKALLDAELKGNDVQRRADSLSALMQVLDKRSFLKPAVVGALKRKHAAAKGADRARLAYALLLLGQPGHAAEVKQYLLGYQTPKDEQELYQLGQMCHALAERGHKFAFDAALHVVDLYAGIKGGAFFMYALSVFWDQAPFEQKRVLGKPHDEAAKIIAAWWRANGPNLSFDGKRFR
jgi:hypothetical protein